MFRRVLLVVLVILQGGVLRVGALDVEQYEIVKRDVPGGKGQWWTLAFSDTGIEIPVTL